jgi:hypothetical protein
VCNGKNKIKKNETQQILIKLPFKLLIKWRYIKEKIIVIKNKIPIIPSSLNISK